MANNINQQAAPVAEEVDSKQFIHNLFEDLKDDEAQKEDIQKEKKERNNKKKQSDSE